MTPEQRAAQKFFRQFAMAVCSRCNTQVVWEQRKQHVCQMISHENKVATMEPVAIIDAKDARIAELEQENSEMSRMLAEPSENQYLRDALKVAREAIENIIGGLGICTCHEGYMSRNLKDPECMFHENEFEIDAGRAALARIDAARKESI